MVLYLSEKKIGFHPVEVYKNDSKSRAKILNSCVSTEKARYIIKEELL